MCPYKLSCLHKISLLQLMSHIKLYFGFQFLDSKFDCHTVQAIDSLSHYLSSSAILKYHSDNQMKLWLFNFLFKFMIVFVFLLFFIDVVRHHLFYDNTILFSTIVSQYARQYHPLSYIIHCFIYPAKSLLVNARQELCGF